ncbi:ABC transporter ATP-binding protein/permease [Aerococcaceae bacterium NML130460]|nr:ABC transporter ATP-binding protein/permease [Aerococcaceae bacterium NML130460]
MKLKHNFWIGCVIALSALEVVYNSMTYSMIFYVIEQKNINLVLPFTVVVILGYLFFQWLTYVKESLVNNAVAQHLVSLKTTISENMLLKQRMTSEDVVSKNLAFFQSDLKLYEENYLRMKFQLLQYLITSAGIIIFSFYHSLVLTIIFSIFTFIPHVVSNRLQATIGEASEHWSVENANVTKVLTDFFKNLWTVKVYQTKKESMSDVQEAIQRSEQSNVNLKKRMSKVQAFTMAVGYFSMFAPVGIGIYFVLKGELSVSTFVAVQYSSSWLINSVMNVLRTRNIIASTKPIQDKVANLSRIIPVNSRKQIESPIEMIEFKSVSFSYQNKLILDNVSFSLAKGEKLLIQGISGSGKSTILKLLTKQLDDYRGQILINGYELKTLSEQEVLSFFGVISQTPQIFNDSILKNLTLGKVFTQTQIQTAVERAGLQQVVADNSLDYHVGEDGKCLSGGQIKRIEIARAMLFGRNVLLVDEATSSLDKDTGRRIIESLLQSEDTIIDIEHHIDEDVKHLFDHVVYLSTN